MKKLKDIINDILFVLSVPQVWLVIGYYALILAVFDYLIYALCVYYLL